MSIVKATSAQPRPGDEEELPSRYLVGIDLGTTNSAVTFLDTQTEGAQIETFAVPQVIAPGQIEARSTLPSFHYQAAQGEFPQDALRLPWSKSDENSAVGMFARDHGTSVPGRMINSAKSWLSHSGVDRTAALLPWHGSADVEKLSPVEVSSRYLQHVRQAWNHRFQKEPLEQQDIVLTLPASFDEIARELTVEAARQAGLNRVVLIEEPQAAFYDWLAKHADSWQQHVSPGQTILVCDIGGGTSDFTLIRARAGEENLVQFHRVAVGEHLILGGDNLDLALAHHLEQKLSPKDKLPADRWSILVRRCRQIKESFLGPDAPQSQTVSLPALGSKLIGGALQCEVTRDEVHQVLAEGFLPECELTDMPDTRTSGFQEFGLPYAPDAAITRWLAHFLTTHHEVIEEESRHASGAVRPDLVLFNGGFFESPVLKGRLLKVLTRWFTQDDTNWQPVLLENKNLDLAVSRGATYYGQVRRGTGVKITANLARTYYIGIGSGDTLEAMCLLPATTEPGQEIDLDLTFQLRVSEPVEFPLFISSTRLIDQPGQLVPIDPQQIKALPPIRTVLRARRRAEAETIPVHLHAKLTEIGTIELWCAEVDSDRTWRLQFDIRSATQTDVAAHESAKEAEGMLDESLWNDAAQILSETFGSEATRKPQPLMKDLDAALEMPRDQWPTSLLRRMWEHLMDLEAGRGKDPTHESRWLNLTGYCLRPGYGLALDDWRVSETWKLLQGKVIHNDDNCRNQSLILWRRIAGGLNRGQQLAIAEPLLVATRVMHKRMTSGGGGGTAAATFTPQQAIEVWRLLGSLELLGAQEKTEIGRMLVDLLGKKKLEPARGAMAWTIGRLGTRTPVYGPLNTLVPKEIAAQWLKAITTQKTTDRADLLAVMQLARRTDDRYRDLAEDARDEAAAWLEKQQATEHWVRIVREGGQLDEEEQSQIFGESLPTGLTLVR
ncbi:molecular chaperone DnaK [Blastopirellula marina]|uniref:Molecular chaperone DnaK n=1 Tax=Blastopirellula marina TaxID=124 RepID=A0A2S8FMS7_9BACT|nr:MULTISPECIES: hsp70 family protein [Pirellulaceae]PQO33461.1 molecular chaperone DnaK [Blastopirellula marina]RCS52551.1 molecular chaperone DnaK [Bremerella cremea]